MAQKIIIIHLQYYLAPVICFIQYACPCPYINRQDDSQKQKKLESSTRIGMEAKDDLMAFAPCLLIFLAEKKHCYIVVTGFFLGREALYSTCSLASGSGEGGSILSLYMLYLRPYSERSVEYGNLCWS
jgi:hypothetical protein